MGVFFRTCFVQPCKNYDLGDICESNAHTNKKKYFNYFISASNVIQVLCFLDYKSFWSIL